MAVAYTNHDGHVSLAEFKGLCETLHEVDALTQVRKTSILAQKLGQLQPFPTVFPRDCVGQLASFGPT